MANPAPVEAHPRASLLSDFILGSQDGVVNVLGIVLGLAIAGAADKFIVIAGLAALAAESVSMAAVAYTSTRSRRLLYEAEVRRELTEMREVPELEREEVREILRGWDYSEPEVEEMLQRIEAKPKAWLDLMMAFELHLAPVAESAALNSAALVGLATLLGSVVPLLPFFFITTNATAPSLIAILLSAVMLFMIGYYEARTTLTPLVKSGVRMLVIGLGSGFAGFLIGLALRAY